MDEDEFFEEDEFAPENDGSTVDLEAGDDDEEGLYEDYGEDAHYSG